MGEYGLSLYAQRPEPHDEFDQRPGADPWVDQGVSLGRRPDRGVMISGRQSSQEAAMSSTDVRGSGATTSGPGAGVVDTKLEVVVIPVSDVDRSKAFYTSLGWRLDADFAAGDGFRIVQLTPPGSPCSVQFGADMTTVSPGSSRDMYLVVSDIEAARNELVARGVTVSEVFHEGSLGDRFHTAGRVSGPAPEHATYGSFASFSDPDGNSWLLQEITKRLPGRVDATTTTFASTGDLAAALRRAAAAHGEHEKRIGEADPNWPDWYAAYMVAEAAGSELPT
jgi:catechol 2,3-dioxygenase-like lactoylglutathione lyase family enzyme